MSSINGSLKEVDLLQRTVRFSRNVMVICRKIGNDYIGKILAQQLFRSAASIGANFHEAQGAQSRADFIAKISIAQKEAIETHYWLTLLKEEFASMSGSINELSDESAQLAKILSAILISTKKHQQK